MTEIRKEFFKYFSEKFDLTIDDENTRKCHYVAEKSVSSEDINESIEKYFFEKGYVAKKVMVGGLLFLKEKEKVIISVTNFSGKRPFSISVSIEFFEPT